MDSDKAVQKLRLRAAVHVFKQIALGGEHEPGSAQMLRLFDEFHELSMNSAISPRAWESWFSATAPTPHRRKMEALDVLAAKFLKRQSEAQQDATILQKDYFVEMVHGGLMRQLFACRTAKRVRDEVIAQASAYVPPSQLHLHFDAIEVASLSVGLGDMRWDEVKAVAATRILELLHERWGPRNGTVYLSFTPNSWFDCGTPGCSNDTIRGTILARFKPDLSQRYLERGASPDWERTGIAPDVSPIHIYKALFAIAADSNFLIGDRFSAWYMDLATAVLAMHALAWTDRYKTFGLAISDEVLFWAALNEVLFEPSGLEIDNLPLRAAMARCDARWTLDSYYVFARARESYNAELSSLGLTRQDVFSTAMSATQQHPLVYAVG
jgi:hypothetical protein